MTHDELQAAAFAALAGVAGKETRRDALTANAVYRCDLTITGTVNGKPFARRVVAETTVNEDETKISSEACKTPHLVAVLLARMTKKLRGSILRDLPDEFARNDAALPDVDAELVEASKTMLGRLRAKISKVARGAVSTTYTIHPV